MAVFYAAANNPPPFLTTSALAECFSSDGWQILLGLIRVFGSAGQMPVALSNTPSSVFVSPHKLIEMTRLVSLVREVRWVPRFLE